MSKLHFTLYGVCAVARYTVGALKPNFKIKLGQRLAVKHAATQYSFCKKSH